jgi:hypothetical protein
MRFVFWAQLAVSLAVAWLLVGATLPSLRRLFGRRWTPARRFIFAALCVLPASVVVLSIALVLPPGRASTIVANLGGVLVCLGCLAALADAFIERRHEDRAHRSWM